MKHSNVAIFVPHVGCPHKCAFCDQHKITGSSLLPHKKEVDNACDTAIRYGTDPNHSEIAFFGGSFTAIPHDYMLELLDAAYEYVNNGLFKGIRISTRPDYIDDQTLELLKSRGVTSIELGAQSLCDDVLEANERGHTKDDVVNASELIKKYGFELGLQMMVGLYKSTKKSELYTMEQIIVLSPKTVRIYPVVVLEDTKLAQLYKQGKYEMIPFDEVVTLCGKMMCSFISNGIKVIKLGLHASELVEKCIVAGYYHPAFSELVQSRIVLEKLESYCDNNNCKTLDVTINPKAYSITAGHKKSNAISLAEKGVKLSIKSDNELEKYQIRINGELTDVFKIIGDSGI
ncbi:MAG: radical SAM protein [Ruminococcus sp.]|nr:radical SAM protein [Ruminococcus sp.]